MTPPPPVIVETWYCWRCDRDRPRSEFRPMSTVAYGQREDRRKVDLMEHRTCRAWVLKPEGTI